MTKSLKLCTAISLMLNVLLLGIVFGTTGMNLIGCKNTHHMVIMHDLLQQLSKEKQADLQQEMDSYTSDIKELREKLVEEREKAIALIEASPFDKGEYEKQIHVVDQVRSKVLYRNAITISLLAAQGDDEERKSIGDTLLKQLKASEQNTQ